MRRKPCTLVLVLLIPMLRGLSQDVTLLGLIPAVQVDGTLSGEVDYFVQSGSEFILSETVNGNTDNITEVLTMDLTGGISFNPGPDWNLAFSFLARSRRPFGGSPGKEWRPMQQATHTARFGKYRLRNRFRSEQRFIQGRKGDSYEFDLRLRYRISVDFPLNGERLDDRELYLNTSVEWLVTPTLDRPVFYSNPRGYVGLGYRFTDTSKLELGPEFRTRNVEEDGTDQHIVYVRLIWVKTI